jgi:hypothetical protein
MHDQNQYLTPEMLAAMVASGTQNLDQQAMARKQARIDALREQSKPAYGAIGGALGAAADVLNAHTAKGKERDLENDAAKMRSSQTDAQWAMIHALLGHGQPAQAGNLAPSVIPNDYQQGAPMRPGMGPPPQVPPPNSPEQIAQTQG